MYVPHSVLCDPPAVPPLGAVTGLIISRSIEIWMLFFSLALKNPNHPYCQVFFRWLHHFQGARDPLSTPPHSSLTGGDPEPTLSVQTISASLPPQLWAKETHKLVLFSPPWAGDSVDGSHHVWAYLLPLVQTLPSSQACLGYREKPPRTQSLASCQGG